MEPLSRNSPDRRLSVKVTPNATRSEVTGLSKGIVQVRVAAPPVAGKANRELIATLSRALGVGKSAVAIVRGQTGRHKVIEVAGLTRQEILRRLMP